MIQLNPGAEPVDCLLNCLSIQLPNRDYWGAGRRQNPSLDKGLTYFKL